MIGPLLEGYRLGVALAATFASKQPEPPRLLLSRALELLAAVESGDEREIAEEAGLMRAVVQEHVQIT